MDVEIIFRVVTKEVFQIRPTGWGGSIPDAVSDAQYPSYDDALDAGNTMLAQYPTVQGFVVAKSYQRVKDES